MKINQKNKRFLAIVEDMQQVILSLIFLFMDKDMF